MSRTHWHIGVGHIRGGALLGFIPDAIPEAFTSEAWARACVKSEVHRIQSNERRAGNEAHVAKLENRTTISWVDQFGENRGAVFEISECHLQHSSEEAGAFRV